MSRVYAGLYVGGVVVAAVGFFVALALGIPTLLVDLEEGSQNSRAAASVDLETARARHEEDRARCYIAMVSGFQASGDTLVVTVDTKRAQVTWVLRHGIDAWPPLMAPTQYLICWDREEERVIYFSPAGFEGMEPMPHFQPDPTPNAVPR